MNNQFTTEQILKIVAEGSHDLGYHEGVSDVLTKLKKDAEFCSISGMDWTLTVDEVEKWAREKFNIDIK